MIDIDDAPKSEDKKALRASILAMNFSIIEAQKFYPLIDLGFTPADVINQLEEYDVDNFRSKIAVLKSISLISELCGLFSNKAIYKAKTNVNIFDTPKLLEELFTGIILIICYEIKYNIKGSTRITY